MVGKTQYPLGNASACVQNNQKKPLDIPTETQLEFGFIPVLLLGNPNEIVVNCITLY